MATARTVAGLKELFSCSVCLYQFEGRDPRSLPCHHAFCFQCLEKMSSFHVDTVGVKNMKRTVKCPNCMGIFEGEPKDLPVYFQANQAQDLIQSLEDYTTCMVCSKAPSSAYCFNCVRTVCEACRTKHSKNQVFAGHVCVDVPRESFQDLVCRSHSELVELHCADCKVSVCKMCVLTEHEEHTILHFIEAESPNELDQLDHEMKSYDKILQKLNMDRDILVKNIQEGRELDIKLKQTKMRLKNFMNSNEERLKDFDEKVETCQIYQKMCEDYLNQPRPISQSIAVRLDSTKENMEHADAERLIKGLSEATTFLVDAHYPPPESGPWKLCEDKVELSLCAPHWTLGKSSAAHGEAGSVLQLKEEVCIRPMMDHNMAIDSDSSTVRRATKRKIKKDADFSTCSMTSKKESINTNPSDEGAGPSSTQNGGNQNKRCHNRLMFETIKKYSGDWKVTGPTTDNLPWQTGDFLLQNNGQKWRCALTLGYISDKSRFFQLTGQIKDVLLRKRMIVDLVCGLSLHVNHCPGLKDLALDLVRVKANVLPV